MTISEIIRKLVNAYDYNSERIFFNDEIIDFIAENLPTDYSYFSEKERAYREVKNELNKML